MKKQKIHLDTDLGADADDLCALAYLVSRQDVELTGITTCLEQNGRRAAYVRYALELLGEPDIPVCAGKNGTVAEEKDYAFTFATEQLMWQRDFSGGAVTADPLECIRKSVHAGAQIVAIGPLTNLARYLERWPEDAPLLHITFMGGCFTPPVPGYPSWGAASDWNIHMDRAAAFCILNRLPVTMVQIAPTLKTFLTERDCAALEQGGPFLQLLAAQARRWCLHVDFIRTVRAACPALPDDLLNFHYDPLTCAIAAGFADCTTELRRLHFSPGTGDTPYLVREVPDGNPVRLVTDVNGKLFRRHWLDVVMQ